MSDRQPRSDGPAPYDGRDLDGLLSGENVLFPEGLRPVARTLDALRLTPRPAELAAEEAARTTFRQIMLSDGTGLLRPVPGTGDSRTVVQPARVADDGPHRHRHRRPPRRGTWQAKALAGAAAAVVVVGAAALVSTLSSSGGHPGHSAQSPGATASAARSSRPGSPGLEGTGSTAAKGTGAKPTPKTSQPSATGAGAGSDPGVLCRQYFASLTRPGPPPDWSARGELGQQLSELAGGPMNVVSYCAHVLQPWAALPPQPADNPGPGQDGNPGPGQDGNGKIGNVGNAGNNQGRNGPGLGSLGRR
jgi:hypothetical protein